MDDHAEFVRFMEHMEKGLKREFPTLTREEMLAVVAFSLWQENRRTTPDREAWQPIETAPRDGTPIIGCTFHPQLMHLYAPCTIFWAAYHPNSEGEKTWRTSAICGNKMKGVTHWMPLPTAPTSDKGGA